MPRLSFLHNIFWKLMCTNVKWLLTLSAPRNAVYLWQAGYGKAVNLSVPVVWLQVLPNTTIIDIIGLLQRKYRFLKCFKKKCLLKVISNCSIIKLLMQHFKYRAHLSFKLGKAEKTDRDWHEMSGREPDRTDIHNHWHAHFEPNWDKWFCPPISSLFFRYSVWVQVTGSSKQFHCSSLKAAQRWDSHYHFISFAW